MKRIFAACVLGPMLLLPVLLIAKGGHTTNYQEDVTTTVFDADTAGTQLLTRSDDYNDVGQATYTSPEVGSEIESVGTWQLDLYGQSLRALWITPNDPINSSQPVAPPAGYYSNVALYSRCFDQSGNEVPFELLVNGSNNCEFTVAFSSNGTHYDLAMGARDVPAGSPPTGLASVACNAVSDNQCVNWTITPNTAAPNANVANLYKSAKELTFVGQYYNTFRIQSTNP